MIRVKLPSWILDEASELVAKQMAMARTLAVRLTDPDTHAEWTTRSRVRARDIIAVVRALDELSKQLDTLVGGTPSFAKDTDDYRTAVAFACYCDRAIAFEKQRKKRP